MMKGSKKKEKWEEVKEGKVILTGMSLYRQYKFHSIKRIKNFKIYLKSDL